MNVKIKRLRDNAQLPAYQTSGSAAMDIAAAIDQPIVLRPLERYAIPTGFALELPEGYEAQVRARSGLSLKHGITLANGIGTIDADYRGEVGVILINISQEPFAIEPGMRIAQMVSAPYEQVTCEQAEALTETDRGAGGYGSTAH
jgi:dUTP pyrophosphatase